MSSGGTRLAHMQKTLRERWDETKADWNDKVAWEFEKNHLQPLDHETTLAVRAMEKISTVLNKLKQEFP